MMNYVFMSPFFPPNYQYFVKALNERGCSVLGIGSEPYDELDSSLKESLTEYYLVKDMENYDEILRACGYFTHHYGKIQRIESHNEHWLEQDARLRTDFNVSGLKSADMECIKYKSKMKEVFRKNGIPVARGKVVETYKEASSLVKDLGFPICAKPDCGVGASHTFKLHSMKELKSFFEKKLSVPYIMEEFIEGEIHTYDGLTDQNGNIVFASTFIFDKGVMETVNEDLDMFYHNLREIPEDLMELGTKAVEAFGLKERFFHIEFFRTSEQKLIALEINVRPPGGLSMDIFNYADDANYYDLYAQIVLGMPFTNTLDHHYYVAYAGRKRRDHIEHRYNRQAIMEKYGALSIYQGPIDSVFSAAIGDYAYVLRSNELELLKEAASFILERKTT